MSGPSGRDGDAGVRPAPDARTPTAHGPAGGPVVLAAGGTAGHVFPAEALAAELQARGHRVALFTDRRYAARDLDGFGPAERIVLPGGGLAGHGLTSRARAAAGIAAGTLQARAVLRRLGAVAVVGFGGYPSVAPVLAARSLRGPRPAVLLHEQNAVLGRANRFLLRHADVLALSLPGTARVPAGTGATVTGNPLRPALLARLQAPRPPADGLLHLLVLGGSLGARTFSDVVPPALAALPPGHRARLRVVQQCRAEDLDRVRAAYAAAGIAAELAPFFPDVAERLARADCAVTRAGASTVAELAAAGLPAVLVPLPHAIDDHQTANARALGLPLLPQPDFTPDALCAQLLAWLDDPGRLARAARLLAHHARPDAAARLADLVEARIAARRLGGARSAGRAAAPPRGLPARAATPGGPGTPAAPGSPGTERAA